MKEYYIVLSRMDYESIDYMTSMIINFIHVIYIFQIDIVFRKNLRHDHEPVSASFFLSIDQHELHRYGVFVLF